ncbi:MAG TPA: hypothetical protein VJ783_19340 [Pirellulales bacterium]|nr:hypothetical protein [Pirellulales bacterium]
MGIEFATAKLLDYAADDARLEADPNPFAVVVLAHLKTLETAHDDEARRVSEVRLVKGLYERGFSAEQIRQLYRLIDGMMDLPRPMAVSAWKEIDDFAKERNMPFLTGADIVLREEVLAEGLAEGLAQAREDLLTGIEVALDVRFGAPGRALLAEIRPIEDLDLLCKILHGVKQADSPDALRRLWAKP